MFGWLKRLFFWRRPCLKFGELSAILVYADENGDRRIKQIPLVRNSQEFDGVAESGRDDAGHKLMVERREIQDREEAHNREVWQFFRAGMGIGFLAGFGLGFIFHLIFR